MDRVHLPSGVVALRVSRDSQRGAVEGLFAPEWEALPYTFARGDEPLPVAELPLRDFHALRALGRRLGDLPDPPVSIECRNCGRRFDIVPSAALELGPFRDGELDDPVLDEPFDFTAVHALASSPSSGAPELELVLDPVTVGRVAPLHVALARRSGWTLTARIVRAMGIASLDEARSPRTIARRLDAAPEAVLDAVAALFEDAYYSPRLTVRHPCPECGMAELVPVPSEREFTVQAPPDAARNGSSRPDCCPDADTFEALVARLAPALYDELGVRNVDLIVEDGPADVDEAGEPLLGSYTPPDPDALPPLPPEIRIYFRSFAAMWEDGEFATVDDIAHEIAVTLRHELAHHRSFLAGDDPIADDEQVTIAREEIGRVGRRESLRRATRGLLGDVLTFFMRTWFVWVLAAIATALAFCEGRPAAP